ncbi:hypothetical protein, partial [Teichococcus deserti]|uniref:hypothetical protein n=1 Tax=Teichococcus deserti TaxID=1817963 RepID=UPI001A967440
MGRWFEAWSAALLAATLLGAGAARGQAPLLPPGIPPEARLPVVAILPDALGQDGRETPYIDRLLGLGFAVLLLEEDRLPALPPPLDPARLGLLGFGAGGRAALAMAGAAPRVALYPACAGWSQARPAAGSLILHPDTPAEAAA